MSSSACSIWSSKSSCVNGSSVGDSADSAIDGMSSASIRIGRWAYEPTSRSPPCWRSYMLVSMSRTIGYVISPTVSANIGTGPTLIIWWTAGVSGIDAPAIARDPRAPDAAAMTTVSASIVALVGADAADVAVVDVDPGDLGARRDRQRAHLGRALAHDRAGPQRVDDADAGRVEAAEDDRVSMYGTSALIWAGAISSDSMPHDCEDGHPALELLHPLGRPGDLDAAALGEDAQLLVLLDAVEREGRHLLRVVGQEDEVRGVAGRAAGVRQRALLDQDDVPPAEPGEVVDEAVADDAGADDDDARPFRKRAHAEIRPPRGGKPRSPRGVRIRVRRAGDAPVRPAHRRLDGRPWPVEAGGQPSIPEVTVPSLFIDGQWIASGDGTCSAVINPSDGTMVDRGGCRDR